MKWTHALLLICTFCYSSSNQPQNNPTPITPITSSKDSIKENNRSIDTSQHVLPSKKDVPRDPFDNLLYDKVLSYNFALKTNEDVFSILDNGKIHSSAELPTRTLTTEEVNEMLSIVLKTSTYGGASASCFNPRWAFVFYRENGIVGYIDLCFECNLLISSPEISVAKAHKFVEYYDGDKIEEPLFGFSARDRKKLKKFCSKLNMMYCGDNESLFD